VARFDPQSDSHNLSGRVARGDNPRVGSGVAKLAGEEKWRRVGAYPVVGHEEAKVGVIEERARGDVGGGSDLLTRQDFSI
jgi:hypothetical protein